MIDLDTIQARFDRLSAMTSFDLALAAGFAYSLDVPLLIAELREARALLAEWPEVVDAGDEFGTWDDKVRAFLEVK
jgi:hypothetical protein